MAEALTVDVNDRRTLRASFFVAAAPTDNAPVFRITGPDGATTEYTGAELDHPAPGVYELGVTFTRPGPWELAVDGSAAAQASETLDVYVRHRRASG